LLIFAKSGSNNPPNREVKVCQLRKFVYFCTQKELYMSKNRYLTRICDFELQNALATMGAVLIEGVKWCGKTSTAAQVAQSILFMQDPDKTHSYQDMADTKPSLLLKGENPR
jgi:hypothetical protein